MEVTEKEDASFETEISEDDIAGEWKLKGEVLTRSPVRPAPLHLFLCSAIASLCMQYKTGVTYPSDVRHPNGGLCAKAPAEKLPGGSGWRGVLPGSERHHQCNAQCQR